MEALSIISLIFSAIALLITFYFNFKSAQINRFNKFSDYVMEFDKIIIEHPELFYIYDNDEIEKRRGTPEFLNRMSAFIYFHINTLENVWFQLLAKKSFLDRKKERDAWEHYIGLLFTVQLTKKIWNEAAERKIYDQDFVKDINDVIKKINQSKAILTQPPSLP